MQMASAGIFFVLVAFRKSGGTSVHQKSTPGQGAANKGTAKQQSQKSGKQPEAAQKRPQEQVKAGRPPMHGDAPQFDARLMESVMARSSQRAQRSGQLVQSCLHGTDKDCATLQTMEAEFKADAQKLKKAGPQYQGMAMGLHSPCLLLPRGLPADAPESKLAKRLGCS